jgi:hypothetical protein
LLTADNLDQASPFSLILVGQPLLRERLAEPAHSALWQRIGVKLRLRPLTDQEVGPFIEGHLRAAGARRKNLFDPEAVTEIFHHSRGIPRLVQNIAARNALIDMDLIAFDGSRFQVLSLPDAPPAPRKAPLTTAEDLENHAPATIKATILASIDSGSDQ